LAFGVQGLGFWVLCIPSRTVGLYFSSSIKRAYFENLAGDFWDRAAVGAGFRVSDHWVRDMVSRAYAPAHLQNLPALTDSGGNIEWSHKAAASFCRLSLYMAAHLVAPCPLAPTVIAESCAGPPDCAAVPQQRHRALLWFIHRPKCPPAACL
jgi:hypothetical protein